MPPSARITFRLIPTLEALVSDRARQRSHVLGIVRAAIEVSLGVGVDYIVDMFGEENEEERLATVAESSALDRIRALYVIPITNALCSSGC